MNPNLAPRKPTILIAEDEAIVARDIRALLVRLGYEPVGRASTAQQALAMTKQWLPDLVLMDISLAKDQKLSANVAGQAGSGAGTEPGTDPGTDAETDGISAAQAIRDRFFLPVIFLTAYSGGETLTRAKLAEPFGYITKPFTERELHTAIEIALYKHQLEAERRRSETKFRALYDSTRDAVMLLDNGRFFDCNQATLHTFGCASLAEFCRKRPADLSPPLQPGGRPSRGLAEQHIQQALAEGSLRFDWQHQRQDNGIPFDAEVLLSALQLDGKTVLQAVVRDISQRKRAEEELRLAKLLLDSVVENIPAMIFVKRASDLRFELVNQAAENLLGLTRAQMLGQSDHELFPAEQADAFTAEDRRVMVSGQMAEIAIEPILHANGQIRFLHTKKVVLRDAAGAPSHLLGISLDITEQKQVAEVLLAAKEEAERANRAKSNFLSSMSHELRTPMNAVLGFAQLLQLDAVTPLQGRQVEYVKQILRGGQHLMSLISDVLDLASIEAGRLSVRLEAVPVRALLSECLDLLGSAATLRGVQIQVLGPTDLGDGVLADRTRLRQVLLNLLSNAIKYNREGGAVEVLCSAEGDAMCISVSDQGPGLSAEQQQRLFQLFERLDAANGTVPGTGIGLALSKRLVEAMHGEMGVTSRVGEGCTFWLRLPRCGPPGPAATT